MTAEVGGGVVFIQQRTKPLQQTLSGPVFRHRPHRVVACHQKEVSLRPSQPLLQPGQLTVCIHRPQGTSGLLIHIIERVSTQHHSVEHDYGKSFTSVWDVEVQLVVVRWKRPKIERAIDTHKSYIEGNDRKYLWCQIKQVFDSWFLPSVRFLAVLNLGFDIPCMVMITSKHVPGDFERLRRVHSLKGILGGKIQMRNHSHHFGDDALTSDITSTAKLTLNLKESTLSTPL